MTRKGTSCAVVFSGIGVIRVPCQRRRVHDKKEIRNAARQCFSIHRDLS
ncbi:MAG TPA: hypothetical protein VMU68_11105 [Acidimicrobiales bacterium]|nr:hypothetical protein [Acidimicrobiales bacterium]